MRGPGERPLGQPKVAQHPLVVTPPWNDGLLWRAQQSTSAPATPESAPVSVWPVVLRDTQALRKLPALLLKGADLCDHLFGVHTCTNAVGWDLLADQGVSHPWTTLPRCDDLPA